MSGARHLDHRLEQIAAQAGLVGLVARGIESARVPMGFGAVELGLETLGKLERFIAAQ